MIAPRHQYARQNGFRLPSRLLRPESRRGNTEAIFFRREILGNRLRTTNVAQCPLNEHLEKISSETKAITIQSNFKLII